MMRDFLRSRFFRFMMVGGFAALVNFVSRIFFNQWMSYRWAIIVAYLVGMLTAFVLSKYMVFEKSAHHPAKELIYFSLVNVVAVIQVWLISVGLAEYLFPTVGFSFYANEVAHLIGLGVPVISSYFGHKYFSFAEKIQP